MKYIKSYIFFVLTVFALTGCNQYDDLKDDVNDLKNRVALIEQQVILLNDNLAVISYILDTQHKTISKVEKSADGTQHVITLSNGEKLTLTIGKPGTIKEPVITVGADKMWYVNGISTGVKAVGQDGKNGDGFPEFRVEGGKWQVRFGGGLWGDVAGSEGIAPGSLGDQFFESAKVEDNQFVVTMKQKDGEAAKVYNFPIVDALTCSIDPNGNTLNRWGYYEFDPAIAGNERKIFLVKVEGDNPQVTYPQGWRAELKKLETADGNGNNYQLIVYAPATTQPISRAIVADNTKDVTVQVQKGAFWAMAKIPVGLPKVYNTLLEKYNEANESFYVGGLEIDYATYGLATEVTSSMTIPNGGGVYIVTADNVTLTYSSTAQLDKLIIVANTSDIKINMNVTKQILLTGTVALQNVVLNNQTANYVLKNSANNTNVSFNNCKINGLVANQSLATMNTSATPETFTHFEVSESDIKIENSGINMYLINNMDCGELIFNQNIVYFSGTVPLNANGIGGNGHLVNFKVFYGTTIRTLGKLRMNQNTFIDVESNGTSGTTGLVYCKEIADLEMSGNLYWLSYPASVFATGGNPVNRIVMVRTATNLGTATTPAMAIGANNYIYNGGNPDVTIYVICWGSIPGGLADIISTQIFFDVTDLATFNKSTGVFIPKDGYKAYGAQRN